MQRLDREMHQVLEEARQGSELPILYGLYDEGDETLPLQRAYRRCYLYV